MTSNHFKPYPWLESLWQGLLKRKGEGHLPHALLFSGPAGLGKRHLATGLAQSILCEQPASNGAACDHCRSCRLFRAGSHPDYLLIEPEEEGKSILVDQVRKLDSFQTMKAHYGKGKVILLEPADRMNTNAANALLKTLEEPTEGTVLILSTDRPMALLPTIRSRCQSVVFQPAQTDIAVSWLKQQLAGKADEQALLAMAANSPLIALEWASGDFQEKREKLFTQLEQLRGGSGDPVSLASEWVDEDEARCLVWLYGWLSDMIRLKSSPDAATLSNPDLRGRLQVLTEKVDLKSLFQILEKVQEALRLLQTQVNSLLVMEELLLTWSRSR